MDLWQSPLFWIGAVILYLTIGYQIAKASLEVYDKWDLKEDDTFGTWMGLRLILFPLSSISEVWDKVPWWFMVGLARIKHIEGEYTGFNMFFWPIRIIWFGLIIAIMCVIIPPVSLVFFIFWRVWCSLVLCSWSFITGLFTNSSPTTPVPVESKTAPIE